MFEASELKSQALPWLRESSEAQAEAPVPNGRVTS